MSLRRLRINHLRNLSELDFTPNEKFNVITGLNGSGKTSLLEAIFILGLGRSFRTHQIRHAIAHHSSSCTLFGETVSHKIGIEKSTKNDTKIVIDGRNESSRQYLARLLPLQLLHADTFDLVLGPSSVRRQFLDWGVFHFNPQFIDQWRVVQRSLLQRNKLLKHAKMNPSELSSWNDQFATAAELVDQMRLQYLQVFNGRLADALEVVCPGLSIEVVYERGWHQEKALIVVLEENFTREKLVGHTLFGPHRANLLFKTNQLDVAQVLSRGYIKLLASTLKVAQVMVKHDDHDHRYPCTVLIDDLASELDFNNLEKILVLLNNLSTQVFITAISDDSLPGWLNGSVFNLAKGRLAS